jgi:hypothetical protein
MLIEVTNHYSKAFKHHGATSQGVNWKDEFSHLKRLDQLVFGIDFNCTNSIADYGCGYGALIGFLRSKGFLGKYYGYEIVPEIAEHAKICEDNDTKIFCSKEITYVADYTVVNGTFHVKGNNSNSEWLNYIRDSLMMINKMSMKGFRFNLLTSYSDKEYKKDNLYYANPEEILSFCLNNFSRSTSLYHGSYFYEFCIEVNKEGIPPYNS